MSITLSPRTIALLHNFAGISPSIVLQPGKKLRVISDAGTLIGVADIEEEFPNEFPVLDITKLLSILKVKSFKECQVEFTNEKITLRGEHTELSFWASATELTPMPAADIPLQEVSFQAEVSAETLDEFIRIGSVLSHKTAKLVIESGKTYLVATTPELANSNDYRVQLGETDKPDCVMPLDVSNLKMMSSNYVIKCDPASQLACFESSDGSLKYYVGQQLE